ncbi:hypothetical protein DPMN_152530 [Dreissena polymorpha]|uniref:Uncharacterized protein n=1 Tax=Dreissena polymorpha TaxID=45954 RepID=A0A9D4FLF5_DREPO|nr:hypothetical protein DPMN_152530 [Dreissena polymorpha]
MENFLTTSLQCYKNGLLNHGSGAKYGMCREITCDAMSYQNIRDGSITDYKHVYQFKEVLKLKCD